eukprot:12469136-Alexandrium_andersonii.AAC.1
MGHAVARKLGRAGWRQPSGRRASGCSYGLRFGPASRARGLGLPVSDGPGGGVGVGMPALGSVQEYEG